MPGSTMAMKLLKYISVVALIRGEDVVVSILVEFWNSIKCFSSPLYICIIINAIVLLILVSSTFPCCKTGGQDCLFKGDVDNDRGNDSPEGLPPLPPQLRCSEALYESSDCEDDSPDMLQEIEKRAYSDEMESEMSNNDPMQVEEAYDSMEATWSAITRGEMEGRDDGKKELKKCITFVAHAPPSSTTMKSCKGLKKFETFNDAVSIMCKGGLRRESLDRIEINKKAEEFIKKFNEDMRLQRKESDQRLSDMINRGSQLDFE